MTAVQLLKRDLDSEMKSGTKMVVNWDMYLEVEKQQIINAQSFAISNADMSNNRGYFDCEKYYYGTYGGNHIVDTNEMIDHIGDANKMVEISDDEIEEYAKQNAFNYYEFIRGAKWYREQLKKKL